MSSRKNRRNAVMIVDVPETFRPQRPWELPPTFSGGELFVRNVAMTQATGFVCCHNKGQLERNMADRKWAIVVRNAHYRWDGDVKAAMRDTDPADLEGTTEDLEEDIWEARRILAEATAAVDRAKAQGPDDRPATISAEIPAAADAGTRLPDAKEAETSGEQTTPDSQTGVMTPEDHVADLRERGVISEEQEAEFLTDLQKIRSAETAEELHAMFVKALKMISDGTAVQAAMYRRCQELGQPVDPKDLSAAGERAAFWAGVSERAEARLASSNTGESSVEGESEVPPDEVPE